MQSYPRLSIEEFGKILIESNDLDPVYCALYTMLSADVLSRDHLARWLLAYSCLYHCGAASYISEFEGDAFFEELMKAARNEEAAPTGERWPRGHERRHWRGAQAINSCQYLHNRYGFRPEIFLSEITPASDRRVATSFRAVTSRILSLHGFGNWISFKLADMIDRLGLAQVTFNYDDVTIYKDPVEAAERLVRQRNNLPAAAQVKPEAIRAVFEGLEAYFADYAAPPLYDRPIGLQEVESILCKWKSHCNGHYPLYNDLTEIHEGLVPWAQVSEVAAFFKSSMPKVPQKVVA